MTYIVKQLFYGLWVIVRIPLFIVAVIVAIFFLMCALQFIILYRKGVRPVRGEHIKVQPVGFWKKLFVLLPRQYVLDKFMSNPQDFGYKGLHIFCGEQGSGKTIAMVEFIRRMQLEYPHAKVIDNFGYKYHDAELRRWEQLLTYNNGTNGVIVGIDELQNWFASGKNTLPEQMLEVVTQNRKNRRIICGTSQVFCRLAKGLREQATMIYEPITLLGCATWVRRVKYIIDSEGNVTERKRMGSYWFVHDKELREMYDTYKVIHALAKDGFKPDKSVNVHVTSNNYNTVRR